MSQHSKIKSSNWYVHANFNRVSWFIISNECRSKIERKRDFCQHLNVDFFNNFCRSRSKKRWRWVDVHYRKKLVHEKIIFSSKTQSKREICIHDNQEKSIMSLLRETLRSIFSILLFLAVQHKSWNQSWTLTKKQSSCFIVRLK